VDEPSERWLGREAEVDGVEGQGTAMSPKDERFCFLVAEGDNNTEACRKVWPDEENPERKGNLLAGTTPIRIRIAEIRDEVNSRSVLALTRKRELLRQMAEGIIPTKVTNGAQGVTETFDRLLAIQTDAKLAGEFEDKVRLSGDSNLKLQFTVGSRGKQSLDPEMIEAQVIETPLLTEPANVPKQEGELEDE